MDEEERIRLLFELLHRPIPWDPIPPWLKLNERMIKEFTQMEINFQLKEAALQQEKLQAFGKLMGVG